VAYVDSTIALPLLTAYALNRHQPRKLKRLYGRRDEMYEKVKSIYLRIGTVSKIKTSRKLAKRASGVGVTKDSS
jgi:deoxyhypusine synthase